MNLIFYTEIRQFTIGRSINVQFQSQGYLPKNLLGFFRLLRKKPVNRWKKKLLQLKPWQRRLRYWLKMPRKTWVSYLMWIYFIIFRVPKNGSGLVPFRNNLLSTRLFVSQSTHNIQRNRSKIELEFKPALSKLKHSTF